MGKHTHKSPKANYWVIGVNQKGEDVEVNTWEIRKLLFAGIRRLRKSPPR